MASLLIEGEFYEEASDPLKEAFDLLLQSLVVLKHKGIDSPYENKIDAHKTAALEMIQRDFMREKSFPHESFEQAVHFRNNVLSLNKDMAIAFYQKIQLITDFLANEMTQLRVDFAA